MGKMAGCDTLEWLAGRPAERGLGHCGPEAELQCSSSEIVGRHQSTDACYSSTERSLGACLARPPTYIITTIDIVKNYYTPEHKIKFHSARHGTTKSFSLA